MTAPTKAEISAALEMLTTIADTIRQLGEVPAGALYGRLSGLMTLRQFDSAIATLKRTGLVQETNHLLRWVDPYQNPKDPRDPRD